MVTYAFAHCPGEIAERFEESFRMNKDGYVPVIYLSADDRAAYCIVEFAYY
jgi:hypothetical protein